MEINGKALEIPAILPKLSDTPGGTRWPGGAVGSHNREILVELLGLTQDQINELGSCGVIDPLAAGQHE